MTTTTQAPVKTVIIIDAPAQEVWRMFSDASFTRQMGGEYVSDWKQGSAIGWKGSNGEMLTSGKILSIEPGKFLQHVLFNNKTGAVQSTITYELIERDGRTTVNAWEEFSQPVTEEEFNDAEAGWKVALTMVKTLLENKSGW